MNTLIFLTVAAASYYLVSIVQTVLHRDFGHRKRIQKVFSAHAIGHHGEYNMNNLQTGTFVDLESHALNYYGIPIVAAAALVYFIAGTMVMIAHLIGVFATFRWHRDARYNFAVVEFWIDNLMGTRRNN